MEVVANYSEAPNPEAYRESAERTARVLRRIWGLNVTGQKNIPMSGPGLIAFWHESYLDPWVLGASVPRAFRGMAKEELLKWWYLGLGSKYLANRGVFFVDRDNMSTETYDMCLETQRNGHLLAIAPEGTHHKKERGVINETKNGVGRIALMLASEGIECPIIPVAMTTDKSFLRHRQPIQSLIGEPVVVNAEATTISQRKSAAKELDIEVSSTLQKLYNQAVDLRVLV